MKCNRTKLFFFNSIININKILIIFFILFSLFVFFIEFCIKNSSVTQDTTRLSIPTLTAADQCWIFTKLSLTCFYYDSTESAIFPVDFPNAVSFCEIPSDGTTPQAYISSIGSFPRQPPQQPAISGRVASILHIPVCCK